jgi:F-type H+-transporting ATPase subunit delta
MSDTRFKSRPESVLEDPGARAVATLYAQSFLSAARQHGVADCQVELHAFLDDVLGKWPEFADVLMSDTVGRDEKLGILERVVAPRSSQFFVNFLQVLVRHGRLSMLPVIREVVVRLTEIESGKQRVRVRSARALTPSSRDEIRASVDAGLLGGMVLQVGDTVFDSSLRSRLKSLRARLVEKAFNEIQSGRDRFSHPEGD